MTYKSIFAGVLLSASVNATPPPPMEVTATENLGDLAIIPYYTVQNGFLTAVHITNTNPDYTQVVKFRLRRAEDSIDVLDFNLILSPDDVWTAYMRPENGVLTLFTSDNSCTAPYLPQGVFPAPLLNLADADEGYIEVIGMGSASANQPISQYAVHDETGVPVDCEKVELNFFEAAVIDNDTTETVDGVSEYVDMGNDLRVHFFIRDLHGGLEFGDVATHIEDFADAPMMTHQQSGLRDGSDTGFDFPDLGGGGNNGAPRGLFERLRVELGGAEIINDWSYNAVNQVATDWIVTFPGQYLMRPNFAVDVQPPFFTSDVPVKVSLSVFDREEQVPPDTTSLQISPRSPENTDILFTREVNVVEWGPLDVDDSVFDSIVNFRIDPALDRDNGWASMTFESQNPVRFIFDQFDFSGITKVETVTKAPVIGFTAWRRSFNVPNLDYGRIIPHSRVATLLVDPPPVCDPCTPCDPCDPPPDPNEPVDPPDPNEPVDPPDPNEPDDPSEEDRISDLSIGSS